MKNNRRFAFRLAGAVAGALLLGTACGQAPAPASTQAGAVAIAFKSISAPSKGDNKVEAVVTQDGKPVVDASVSATFSMPAMPAMNMPEMHTTTALEHQGGGRYVGTGQLSMTGTWNVTVTVSRDGARVGSARFTLMAK